MSGLSSGALGGIVAAVFIGVTVCAGIVLVGFCCWSNYQDSRMTSYNNHTNNTSGTSQTEEDPRLRVSIIRCLRNGCFWHEEREDSHDQLQHQSNTTMLECVDTINSNIDANLVAPSESVESDAPVSDSNDIKDCGVTVATSLASDVTISADVNRSAPPSPSQSDASIITITDDHEAESDVNPAQSGETNVTPECEVNTSADVDHPSNVYSDSMNNDDQISI